jgi:type IV pilus assembly protein PilP
MAVAGCTKEEKPQPPAPQPPAQKAPPSPQKQLSSAKPAVAAGQPSAPGVAAGVQRQLSSARPAAPTGPVFDFTGKRDPFKPFVEVQQAAKAAPVLRPRDVLPIQSFDVEKFRVIGIITGMAENRAMIVDPSGKGYVVKSGMEIGTNEGRISRITATSVEVIERFRDDNGRLQQRTVKLTLSKKK